MNGLFAALPQLLYPPYGDRGFSEEAAISYIVEDIATGFGAWIGPMILVAFAVVVVVYGIKFFNNSAS